MGAEPLCTLRDCSVQQFSDEDGFLPPVPGDLSSVEELVNHLRAAAARRPHIFHMELPGRVRVVIALGGPWGSVSVHHLLRNNRMTPNHPPSWDALADKPPPVEYVAFLTEGSEAVLDIPADHLLPAEDVIRIAAHLAEHRTLARTHTWLTHDVRGTPIYAGRDRPWEDWDKPVYRYDPSRVPF
jgi:hypothetical protein